MKGLFITFEGGEGSGKTTVIQLLKKELGDMKDDVVVTREPGGVEVAEKIREVIMNYHMDPLTEVYLYASARREHLVQKVIPALRKGKIVLCDRFVDSSIVYQGFVRGVGMDVVQEINNPIVTNNMPNLTLWLDVDVSEGLNRIKKNKKREVNRFDEEEIDFHLKVREGYQMLYAQNRERIKRIDANQVQDSVVKQCLRLIKDIWIPLNK